MPNPAETSSYPQFFADIETVVSKTGPTFPTLKFSCGTKGRAIHLRQRFYGWRQIRIRAGGSPQLMGLTVGIDGDIITFAHADDAFGLARQMADQLKDLGLGRMVEATPSAEFMKLVKSAEPPAASERGVVEGVVETQTSPSEQEAVLRKLGLIP